MTDAATPHRFGQPIAPHHLSPLARQMAAAIGEGSPARWAGFVWHRPLEQCHRPPSMEQHRSSRAA